MRPGRRAVHRVEGVDEPQRFERGDHAGRDHAAHRPAFDRERDARAVAVRRPALSGGTPPQDLGDRMAHLVFLKISFAIFTCTPTFGRSTSCVIATCPARLVS